MERTEQEEAAALQRMSAEGSLKTIRNKSRYQFVRNVFSYACSKTRFLQRKLRSYYSRV